MDCSLRGVMRLVLSFVAMIIAGCASMDRGALSSIEPIKSEGGYRYFKFAAKAGSAYGYPLNNPEAEKIRIGWLEEWLTLNGYKRESIQVLSREPMTDGSGIMGPVYTVFYTVRVPSPK